MPVHALFIDDDQGIVDSVEALAESRGFTLASARTWDDGIGKFNALSPDLVITDYNLPGSKFGLRLLFEIAKIRPSVRLVLISAYLNVDDVKQVEQLGLVSRILRKVNPVETAKALLGEIEEVARAVDAPSDWVSFANAAARTRGIAEEDFDRLDNLLRERVLGDKF